MKLRTRFVGLIDPETSEEPNVARKDENRSKHDPLTSQPHSPSNFGILAFEDLLFCTLAPQRKRGKGIWLVRPEFISNGHGK